MTALASAFASAWERAGPSLETATLDLGVGPLVGRSPALREGADYTMQSSSTED